MTLLTAVHDTPAGPFTLISTGTAVCAAGFSASLEEVVILVPRRLRNEPIEEVAHVDGASDAVLAWCEGDVEAPLSVAVDVDGSPFQRRAWAELRRIPAGRPLTYGGLAAALGSASARAAGRGCATNPTSLFVPCHRVVRADGAAHGFAWGVPAKERALAHEVVHARR